MWMFQAEDTVHTACVARLIESTDMEFVYCLKQPAVWYSPCSSSPLLSCPVSWDVGYCPAAWGDKSRSVRPVKGSLSLSLSLPQPSPALLLTRPLPWQPVGMETTGTETPNCRSFHKREKEGNGGSRQKRGKKKRIETRERGETFSDQKSKGGGQSRGCWLRRIKGTSETEEVFTPQTKTQIKGIESLMQTWWATVVMSRQ